MIAMEDEVFILAFNFASPVWRRPEAVEVFPGSCYSHRGCIATSEYRTRKRVAQQPAALRHPA